MSSPKIDESLIPSLYRLGKRLKKPMTKIVNEMIRAALLIYENEGPNEKSNISNNRNISYGDNKILCPVCRKMQPARKMRDIEFPLGRKKHLLAICDDCFEKCVRPKLEKPKDDDFPF